MTINKKLLERIIKEIHGTTSKFVLESENTTDLMSIVSVLVAESVLVAYFMTGENGEETIKIIMKQLCSNIGDIDVKPPDGHIIN